jgi:hypothetical protein
MLLELPLQAEDVERYAQGMADLFGVMDVPAVIGKEAASA